MPQLPDASRNTPTEADRATTNDPHERHQAAIGELGKAWALTRVEIGEHHAMTRSQVSELEAEAEADLFLSTQRRHIAASGGELTLTVTYPNSAPVPVSFEPAAT